jgi:hypothetical protein
LNTVRRQWMFFRPMPTTQTVVTATHTKLS